MAPVGFLLITKSKRIDLSLNVADNKLSFKEVSSTSTQHPPLASSSPPRRSALFDAMRFLPVGCSLRASTVTCVALLTSISGTVGFTCSPFSPTASSALASSLKAAARNDNTPDVVVISPPGGLGEIASVEAARLGGSVKWFVVSAPSPSGSAASSTLALTSDTLAAIEQAGGSIELAGSDAESLLLGSDDGSSAASAVASWCRGTKSVICTYDGDEEEKRRVDRAKTADDRELGNEVKAIRSGIRVAAREAIGVASSGATKVAMLYSGDEMGGDANKEKKGGLLQGLFGGNAAQIPDTLSDAMKGSINVIRYGELFGAAESSVSDSYCQFVLVPVYCIVSHLVAIVTAGIISIHRRPSSRSSCQRYVHYAFNSNGPNNICIRKHSFGRIQIQSSCNWCSCHSFRVGKDQHSE